MQTAKSDTLEEKMFVALGLVIDMLVGFEFLYLSTGVGGCLSGFSLFMLVYMYLHLCGLVEGVGTYVLGKICT